MVRLNIFESDVKAKPAKPRSSTAATLCNEERPVPRSVNASNSVDCQQVTVDIGKMKDGKRAHTMNAVIAAVNHGTYR